MVCGVVGSVSLAGDVVKAILQEVLGLRAGRTRPLPRGPQEGSCGPSTSRRRRRTRRHPVFRRPPSPGADPGTFWAPEAPGRGRTRERPGRWRPRGFGEDPGTRWELESPRGGDGPGHVLGSGSPRGEGGPGDLMDAGGREDQTSGTEVSGRLPRRSKVAAIWNWTREA